MNILYSIRTAGVLFVALLLVGACSASLGTEQQPNAGTCADDASCPLGQECVGGGCVSVRPTLFSHIQLASALFRPYISVAERDFRASHADLLIGQTVAHAADLRQANPNVRLVTYFTNRYHLLAAEAEAWCAAGGVDPEDFYLHYREDVTLAGYSEVLVPGYPVAFVPGWNPNAQPGDPPASAANRAESRAFGAASPDHPPWAMANFDNSDYRAFVKDYIRRKIEGTVWGSPNGVEPLDGVLMDHGVYYPQWNEGLLDKTHEFFGIPLDDNHPYGVAFETFYPELREYLNGLFNKGVDVVPNYGHVWFLSQPDRFSQGVQDAVDWAWGEVWVTNRAGDSPLTGSDRVITHERDYQRGIAEIARQSAGGKRRILGSRDLSSGTTGSDRGKIFTLALYYLAANVNTFYAYETVTNHMHQVDVALWQWNAAVQADIGSPARVPDGVRDFDGNISTTEHYVFETGPDPFNAAIEYTVLARRFTKGIVLAKMLRGGSVTDDRSITHHDLGGNYRIVSADGSLGPPTTTVSLRNNEGAICVSQ